MSFVVLCGPDIESSATALGQIAEHSGRTGGLATDVVIVADEAGLAGAPTPGGPLEVRVLVRRGEPVDLLRAALADSRHQVRLVLLPGEELDEGLLDSALAADTDGPVTRLVGRRPTVARSAAIRASVVLPALGDHDAVLRTLLSLDEHQDSCAAGFEVLLVDDETDPATTELLRAVSGDVTVVHGPVEDAALALDSALRRSSSELVVCLRPGAVVHPRWLDDALTPGAVSGPLVLTPGDRTWQPVAPALPQVLTLAGCLAVRREDVLRASNPASPVLRHPADFTGLLGLLGQASGREDRDELPQDGVVDVDAVDHAHEQPRGGRRPLSFVVHCSTGAEAAEGTLRSLVDATDGHSEWDPELVLVGHDQNVLALVGKFVGGDVRTVVVPAGPPDAAVLTGVLASDAYRCAILTAGEVVDGQALAALLAGAPQEHRAGQVGRR